MNITKEQIDNLNAIIGIEITPDDYKEKVENKLREYRRKANMPGFRPGNVPMGLIKKMYGTSALVDIIDKMTSESLYNYIKENNLDILGSPLTNTEKNEQPEFTDDRTFNFYFDIALNPEFELNLESIEVDYYNITTGDEFIEKQINNVRQRYGHSISPETSEEDDRIFAHFQELDDDKNVLEGGISHKASVLPKMLKKKENFVGLKKEDSMVIDIRKVFDKNEIEIAHTLSIDKEKVATIGKNFKFTVEDIFRIMPHELNEELYKQIFPYGDIKTEEEFKIEFRNEYEKQNQNQTDIKFINDVHKALIEKSNITLPDDFLKRWILHNDEEGKITAEKLEADYDKYADSMKWQLIENKLIKTYGIKVDDNDITEYIMSWFKRVGDDNEDEELRKRATDFAAQMMKNKEEAKRIYDKLYDDKMMNLFKEKIKITKKATDWEEFIKLA